jgi:hypothetical protein
MEEPIYKVKPLREDQKIKTHEEYVELCRQLGVEPKIYRADPEPTNTDTNRAVGTLLTGIAFLLGWHHHGN